MIEWWQKNFSWIKWLLGLIWTVFVFGIGNYISFRETRAEITSLKETIKLTTKIVEKFDIRFTKIEDYILYKEQK